MFEKFRNYISESYQDFKQDPRKYILKKPYIALALATTGLLRFASQVIGFYIATLLFTEVAIVALAGNFIAAGLTLIPALAALHYSGLPFTIAKSIASTGLKPVNYIGKFALANIIDYCLEEYGFVERIKNRPVGELYAASPLITESEDTERPRRNQSLVWNLIIDTVEFGFGPFRFSPSASFRYTFPYDLGLGLINKIFYDSGLEERARNIHKKRTQEALLSETRELVNFLRSPAVLNNHIPSTQEETNMRDELKAVSAKVNLPEHQLLLPSKFVASKLIVPTANINEIGQLVLEARHRRQQEGKLKKVVIIKPNEVLRNWPQEIARMQLQKRNTIISALQYNIQSNQEISKIQTESLFERNLKRITPSIANYLYANVIRAREHKLHNIRTEIGAQQEFTDNHIERSQQRLNKAMLYMQTFDNRREAQQRLNELFTETKPKRNGAKTIRQKHEAVLEEIKQPRKKTALQMQ